MALVADPLRELVVDATPVLSTEITAEEAAAAVEAVPVIEKDQVRFDLV